MRIDFDTLARWLIACQKHPDAEGTIAVSFAEACNLVSMGFRDAIPGRWRVPPLPEITARYPALAEFRTPASKPPTDRNPIDGTNSDHGVSEATADPGVLSGADGRTAAVRRPVPTPIGVRLREALADSVQRRMLEALMRRPDGPVERRRLQHALHRLKPPTAFSAALTSLISAGVVTCVTRDGIGCLLLAVDARTLLVQAQIGVRRPRGARTMRQTRERHRKVDHSLTDKTPPVPVSKSSMPVKPGQRRYQRRPIPDGHRDRRAWALAMLGRLGGLRAQESYRTRLVMNPTAKATRVRLAKQRARQERATATAGLTPAAPATATEVSPATPGNVRASAVTSSFTGSGLSAAWRSLRPIGRDARLAQEWRRR